MPKSLSKIYVHLIFSTKNRIPLIDEQIADDLFHYLGGACRALDCQPLQVGGYKDHVHILCILSRTITIAKLVEEVKKQSSRWIKEKGDKYASFYWQRGYGIFSVSQHRVDTIVKYIQNQSQYHQKQGFKTEYRAILSQYQLDYEEEYIWD